MSDLLIRCSSLGKIMTSPTAAAIKAGETLSVGAKTYIRKLAAEAIFGTEFVVSSPAIEKGIRCEQEAIGLLNRVRGLSLSKNTERRTDGFITGECDLFDAPAREGYDTKCPWSIATFPLLPSDGEDAEYEWQCRGYLKLWDAERWTVAHCLVNTPEDLIRFEPVTLHFVDHIPEYMRVTTWTVARDAEKEAAMLEKVKHAREYFAQVVAEFDRTHRVAPEVLALAA